MRAIFFGGGLSIDGVVGSSDVMMHIMKERRPSNDSACWRMRKSERATGKGWIEKGLQACGIGAEC